MVKQFKKMLCNKKKNIVLKGCKKLLFTALFIYNLKEDIWLTFGNPFIELMDSKKT